MSVLSNKIKEYRKVNNLTQDDLASKLNVSRTAVSKWETDRGYPSLDILKDISDLLGVSIDELLTSKEIKEEVIKAKNINYNKIKYVLYTVISLIIVSLVFSIIAIINSNKRIQDKPVEYELIGLIVDVSKSEKEILLDDVISGKYAGYYTYYKENSNVPVIVYNNTKEVSEIIKDDKKEINIDFGYIYFTDEVYLLHIYFQIMDLKTNNISFKSANSTYIIGGDLGISTGFTEGKVSFNISFTGKRIGKLVQTKIYEYDNTDNLIKESIIDFDTLDTYIIDSNMLYLVIEDTFEIKDGNIYKDRLKVFNSEINPSFYYQLKLLNEFNWADKYITIRKYNNN